ncbi:YnbE family lipoprotein [Thalassolituus sp. LLYu03]|uniref:YnbE family lipoprotein n=1 Tax=Thalassolituus sp. LLYu03 TaxID=3421656 RepID=UPI003D277085
MIKVKHSLLALLMLAPLSACTLKVAAPDKPITINLNVKIEHEVRVKVEKELEDLFKEEDGLF